MAPIRLLLLLVLAGLIAGAACQPKPSSGGLVHDFAYVLDVHGAIVTLLVEDLGAMSPWNEKETTAVLDLAGEDLLPEADVYAEILVRVRVTGKRGADVTVTDDFEHMRVHVAPSGTVTIHRTRGATNWCSDGYDDDRGYGYGFHEVAHTLALRRACTTSHSYHLGTFTVQWRSQ